jgi:hypothetical protein
MQRLATACRLLLVCFVGALSRPAIACADGALPDSLGVLLPLDHPQQIMIATNFGLLSSADTGKTWRLACEEAIGFGAALYQLGPPPEDRIFTVTVAGTSTSSDMGCGWEQFTSLDRPTDIFPDPSDAQHVMAIARASAPDGSAPPVAVFESKDAGRTYGEPLFIAPASAYVTGVEIARSKPSTIYITMTQFDADKNHPYIVRSTDGGAHWTQIELEPSIGMLLPRILGIDWEDEKRVYLRLGSTGMDQFAVYDDDAGSVSITQEFDASMSAFLRREDRSLIVATRTGEAFVSHDRGESFTVLNGAPHLRGLGERDGVLYAATDNVTDGFAVAVSKDDAKTWQPLLRFQDIQGPLECGNIAETCAMPWALLKAAIEMPGGPEEGFDAGVPPETSPPDASPSAKASNPRGGGGCAIAGRARNDRGWLGLALVALVGAALRARRVHRRWRLRR